jgi:TorA maturation chaperone TorD
VSGAVDAPPPGEWLERAACWRFASTLFRTPSTDVLAELHALLPALPNDTRDSAADLVSTNLDEWEREFHRLLGPGGLPSCESSFDRAALAGRGPLLASIGGFYQAFAYRGGEGDAVPDDIAVELDFLAYLAFKAAFAGHERELEALTITVQAYEAFLRDHLAFWIAPFLDSLLATDSTFYREAAAWLRLICERLAAATPSTRRP